MDDAYRVSQSVVREHCEFFSQSDPTNPPKHRTDALGRLEQQVRGQGGIVINHYMESGGKGLAVAAFPTGVRTYYLRLNGTFTVTGNMSWETLSIIKSERENGTKPLASKRKKK